MGLNTKCPKHGNLHPDIFCPDRRLEEKFKKLQSYKDFKLLSDRSNESTEAEKLLLNSAGLLEKHGITFCSVPIGGTLGPELHFGPYALYGLNEIKAWLDELNKEESGR